MRKPKKHEIWLWRHDLSHKSTVLMCDEENVCYTWGDGPYVMSLHMFLDIHRPEQYSLEIFLKGIEVDTEQNGK